jgi:hypothetical protein
MGLAKPAATREDRPMRELTQRELDQVSGGTQLALINEPGAHANVSKNTLNVHVKDGDQRFHLILNKNNVILKLWIDDLKINARQPI